MRYRLASALTALLLLSACGPDLLYHRAPSVTIPAGASWAWSLPDGDGLPPHDGGVVPADSIARIIASALEQELAGAGFPRTTADSAQFIVHYHVARRTVTDTLPPRGDTRGIVGGERAPGTWGAYGRPEELDDRTITWDEGMLIVDVLPRDRSVVAWRGAIAGEIAPGAARNAAPALREAIRRLMRGFP